MNDDPLPAPTLQELERALDEAVTMIVSYRRQPPPELAVTARPADTGFNPIDIAQLIGTDEAVLRARDIAGSPVDWALKRVIKELGKLIHQQVGDDGMLDVAERVAGRDDANWQRRMSPINSAWNGIGSWYS